ncbi:MAG: holo-ACP synthase [Clostridiaceae bacterium]|nr:holo-ACP synthase [Clostridiaceae bacterium]
METIVGIGIDAVEVSRVVSACQNKHFVQKYFSAEEQELFQLRIERAAVNFAGKEAVAKAFGTGFRGLHPREIAILRAESGKPYVKLAENAQRMAEELGISRILITLTDTSELAVAQAVCLGD